MNNQIHFMVATMTWLTVTEYICNIDMFRLSLSQSGLSFSYS
jgi:hypothetical protein